MDSSPFKVLFDNNVFADIAENRNNAHTYLSIIKQAISENVIVLPASVEVLNEIAPCYNRKEFEKRWALFYELVDWGYILKPSADLLMDEIKSIARDDTNANPFISPQYPHYDIIASLSTTDRPPSGDILAVFTNFLSESKNRFRNIINSFRDDWHGKVDIPRDFTFQQYWQDSIKNKILRNSFPKLMLFHLAKSIDCGYRSLGSTMDKLLSQPTILLAIGYWSHSAFYQVTSGRREKPSVQYDFKHTIHAGAIGNFVTGDRSLRNTITDIPGHDVNVYSLKEFSNNLNRKLNGT